MADSRVKVKAFAIKGDTVSHTDKNLVKCDHPFNRLLKILGQELTNFRSGAQKAENHAWHGPVSGEFLTKIHTSLSFHATPFRAPFLVSRLTAKTF
jgi:hypothetical protein